ncbi:four helix bundle protein [Chitinimonas sp.]|uniref:four helix bundle protein n=1 Tax=Chitinimonas sp. TaxID=1934313 RepID=UPI0035B4764E
MRRAHKDLRVWQSAMQLVEQIYRLTDTFPREELFGLSSQMRRAAVSVPSNIAEGSARQSTKELLHFLSIAAGSLAELDTQLELAGRIGYTPDIQQVQVKLDETSALLQAARKSLKAQQ